MTIERKLLKTAATTSEVVYVEDVFNTSLYTGNGSTQTITTGVNLATKGGMIFFKNRSNGNTGNGEGVIVDTIRGATIGISPTSTSGSGSFPLSGTTVSTSGFGINYHNYYNRNGDSIVSWTFRRQPKFFDIVTYTGNSSPGRQIAHNLGSTPGFIIIKNLSSTADWFCYHRGRPNTVILLNGSGAAISDTGAFWIGTPTSSHFTVGDAFQTNGSGSSFVAYLFAHDAGGFGAAGTDSVVSCGSYTGNGSASGPSVNIGWEPQFVLIKNTSSTGNWNIFDTKRGIPTGAADPYLFANLLAAEATTNGDLIDLASTGFTIKSTNSQVNTSGNTYIFVAIRKITT